MFSSPPLNGQSSLYTGLKHYWDLNGNSRDQFTTRQPSTDTAVGYLPKIGTKCASITPTTGVITTAVNGPTGNAARSMSCWFMQPATASHTLMGYGTGVLTGFDVLVYSGTLRIHISGDSWGGLAPTPGVWNHAVVTHDGVQTQEIYLNGVKGTSFTTHTLNTASGIIKLGAGAYANYQSGDLYLDDTCMWNRALTAGEVASLYNSGSGIETLTGSLTTGLLHQWHLNGNSVDSVDGSGNGTDTAVGYAPKLGSGCAGFNGTTSKSTLPSNFSLANGYSVSAWVLTSNASTSIAGGGYNGIFGSTNASNCLSVDGKKATYCAYYSGAYHALQGTADINDNAWHHVVITHIPDGTAYLYVDGGTPVTANLTYNTVQFAIGRLGLSYQGYMHGLIDQTLTYDRALTSDEVASLYNSGNGTTTLTGSLQNGLIHRFNLDGNSYDISAGNGSDTAMSFPRPKLGSGCAVFDGSSSNIATTLTTPTGAAARTFSFWFNSLQIVNRTMLGYGSYGYGQQFSVKMVAGSVYIDVYGAQYLIGASTANTWHQVTVTYDGTTLRGYLDNVANTPVTVALNTGVTYPLRFGYFATPPSWQGCIDAAFIWNRALTAGEVATVWNSGAGIESPTGSILTGLLHHWHFNSSSRDWVDGSGDGVDTGISYDPSLGAAMYHAIPSMTSKRQFHTATRLADGKVLVAGGAVTAASGVQYASFNGSTSLIQTSIFGPLYDLGRTVNVWFKQPTAANEMILGYGSAVNDGGFQVCLSGGQIAVDIYGTTYQFGISLVNTWHQFVATYDGTTLRGYLDGAEGTPVVKALNTDNANALRIGWSYTGNHFTGSIDEIGMWSRALTYEEVAILYNNGAGIITYIGSLATGLLHHWHLDTDSVDIVDGSGNGTDTDVTYLGSPVLATCEVYDPALATWTDTGPMAQGRYSHTAELLSSGKVLVVGGTEGTTYLATCELYDPTAGTWASTGSLATARITATTALASGSILAAGGQGLAGGLATCEIYDPTAATWSSTGSMGTARYYHAITTMADGKVLATGGRFPTMATAEVYDPTATTWSPVGSMASARYYHTSTLLASGKVLIADGYVGGVNAELYDPTTTTFSNTGRLGAVRNRGVATLLSTGGVLITGGIAVSTSEIYTQSTNGWKMTEPMSTARYGHTATLLTNGTVLVAGGYFGSALSACELYSPGASALTGPYATFNGSTSLITTSLLGPSGAAPRSLSLWLKPSATQTKRVCGYGTATAGGAFQVYLTGGNIYVDIHGTTYAFGAISAAVWHHFATTYDGATLRGYLDGVAGTPVTVTLTTAATGALLMGGGPSGTGYSGSIDECKLWTRALTAAEITRDYNTGVGMVPPF